MFTFSPELIRELQEHNHTAFDTFYIETVDIFFRYIYNTYSIPQSDIQDILSDFYVKIWRSIKQYNTNQPFNAYIRAILKNTIKDYLKKKQEYTFSHLSYDEDTPFEDTLIDETDIIELLEKYFQHEQIQQAMEQLDETSKEIIFLKFIEEQPTTHIAQLLQLSEDNVRQKTSRAIKHLKTLLSM